MTDKWCINCRFWATEEATAAWDASSSGMRECLGVEQRWDIADRASEGMDRWSEEPGAEEAYDEKRRNALAEALAYVEDGSEYRARLVTGPGFYCAKFAEKSDTK